MLSSEAGRAGGLANRPSPESRRPRCTDRSRAPRSGPAIASNSPAPARASSTCCRKRCAEQLAQPPLGARAAPAAAACAAVCARNRSIVSTSSGTPFAGRRLGLHDRRPPLAGRERLQRQHRLDRRHRPIGALAIGLVDDEDVGDLHDAGLERLHLVAGARHERDDRHVGGADDVDLVLADADGLDEDDVLAGGVEDERDFARSRGPGRRGGRASPCCG